MKAITILEPWASLIACGAKKIETRGWATKYRGPIAIHAGKSMKYLYLAFQEPFKEALMNGGYMESTCFGNVIAIADLVDCLQVQGKASLKICEDKRSVAYLENDIRIMGNEFEFGDYTPGRYAWILDNVKQIEPVPARGQQRIWEWEGMKNNGETDQSRSKTALRTRSYDRCYSLQH